MRNNGFRLLLIGVLSSGVYSIIYRGFRSGNDTWQIYLAMVAFGFSIAALLFWFPKNDFPPIAFFRELFSSGPVLDRETISSGSDIIKGETALRLTRCIDAFPDKYPDYRTRRPKLDTDIRPWIKEEFAASEREAHVFGAMLAEHFDLSSDPQKTK